MRSFLSSFATSSSAPLSWPLRPIFHASATRIEYASIGSGLVVGTISTASWLPVCCSHAASFASSACASAGASVPVRSVTRARSGGIGSRPSEPASHAWTGAAPEPQREQPRAAQPPRPADHRHGHASPRDQGKRRQSARNRRGSARTCGVSSPSSSIPAPGRPGLRPSCPTRSRTSSPARAAAPRAPRARPGSCRSRPSAAR